MRKFFTVIIVALSIIALTACNSNSTENIVETNVGNISKDDFYNMLKERYGEEVLQELVLEMILADKYEVSDDEIERTLNQFREQLGEAIDQQYTAEELNRVAKFQVLQEKAFTKDITVSEEDIQAYYDEIKPEIHARHILVADEELANDLKKQLDDGADFAKLAEENSEDPGSVDNGGDLGWFGAGVMVPEFEEAAYALNIDEIGEPIETNHGWHIIQLLDKKNKEPLDEMKAEIEHLLKLNEVDGDKIRESVARELKDSKVKIKDKDLANIFQQFEQ